MKHPDKIRSRINKLKQTLPELEYRLESGVKTGKSESIIAIDRANLIQTEARIVELEWVLEEGEE